MNASRRQFIKASSVASATLLIGVTKLDEAWAQGFAPPDSQIIQTPVLTIGFEDEGRRDGFPIVLLHGFPDDVRAWDEVVPALINAGYRTLRPYLRGFGPTRFRSGSSPRMAEQAAIAQDLIDFVDALRVERFAVVGYDWGGRAASIVAALHPGRVRGAVIIGGYSIQNTLATPQPGPPEADRERWYQWYFNTEVGRAALATNRRNLCRLLWQTWSPGWRFSDATFNRTANSFDNPDFVDIVTHSYRHRIGNAPGEPRFIEMEQRLAQRPQVSVPSILLYGANDPLARPTAEESPTDRLLFPLLKARRVVANAGHFLPRETPDAVASAALELLSATRA
jgi:pimeloyl-ACP methyl ester carboxylesterase